MKNKAILILVLIVGFLLGIMVGYSSKRVDTKSTYQQGYEKGWQEAKNLIEEKVPFLQTPKEVFSIEGEVLEVSTDWLKIKAKPVSINPLSELYKETIRKVKITPATEVIKEERILPPSPKSPEELEKLLKERQKKITLSEIKKGDRVRVTSKENILTKKEFQADKIVLMK